MSGRWLGCGVMLVGGALITTGCGSLVGLGLNGGLAVLLLIAVVLGLALSVVRTLAPVPEPLTVLAVYRFSKLRRFIEPGQPRRVLTRLERLGPALSVGLQSAPVAAPDLLSQDRVPFEADLFVMYRADPRLAQPEHQEQYVRLGDAGVHTIVARRGGHFLRRTVGSLTAEQLMQASGQDHVIAEVVRCLGHNLGAYGIQIQAVSLQRLLPAQSIRQVLAEEWTAQHRSEAARALATPLLELVAGQSPEAAAHLLQMLVALRVLTGEDLKTVYAGDGTIFNLGNNALRPE